MRQLSTNILNKHAGISLFVINCALGSLLLIGYSYHVSYSVPIRDIVSQLLENQYSDK